MPVGFIHPDLLVIRILVFIPSGFEFTAPQAEAESAGSGACGFGLNGFAMRFRAARITPTKIGQFVTLWKRTWKGPIQPFDDSDHLDFFIASTRKDNHFGHFVFPKSVLLEQNIVSRNGKGGKRAIRVYPPWDKTASKQAQKTQGWQLRYFLEMSGDLPIDPIRAKALYR